MDEYPSYAAFVENLHSRFRIEAMGGVELELASVSERRLTAHHEAFSVVLCGPGDAFLMQRTYSMAHDRLGALDLFIVPIGKDENGYAYEAVFNRRAE